MTEMHTCQSGRWKAQRPTAVETRAASTLSCGNYASNEFAGLTSNALCSAATTLVGGGYKLEGYYPVGEARSNAPDRSYPSSKASWTVYAGGAPGASCFRAFALCAE